MCSSFCVKSGAFCCVRCVLLRDFWKESKRGEIRILRTEPTSTALEVPQQNPKIVDMREGVREVLFCFSNQEGKRNEKGV